MTVEKSAPVRCRSDPVVRRSSIPSLLVTDGIRPCLVPSSDTFIPDISSVKRLTSPSEMKALGPAGETPLLRPQVAARSRNKRRHINVSVGSQVMKSRMSSHAALRLNHKSCCYSRADKRKQRALYAGCGEEISQDFALLPP